ncbi:MAG: Vitamin B12 dependent methionine synthase activation subunit [Dorea sp.]
MDTRTKEAIRYLGYGNHAIDDKILAIIQDSFVELERCAVNRIVYRIFDLNELENECVKIEDLVIESKNLNKNLKGCKKVIMLGATLGVQVDMLLKRYSFIDMAKAVVIQACSAALLEEYLDEWQKDVKKEMKEQGLYLRPRFSPGYGDFLIENQKYFLQMLDAPKKIGLSMTDSSMLTPTKSVTAVIGLSENNTACHHKGCEECGKSDCIFRRNT